MNIEELEAQLARVDRLSEVDPVEASLEESGSLSISVRTQRVVPGGPGLGWPYEGMTGAVAPENSRPQFQTRRETVLELDVNEVEVPDAYVAEKLRAAMSNRGWDGLPGVKVSQIGASDDYEVVEDYTYACERFNERNEKITYSITAPSGFVFDRASVPRIFWVLISKDDLSNVPPLFHDLLYRNGGVLPKTQVTPYRTFQREEADELFYELMQKSGVKPWRSRLAYLAVSKSAVEDWKVRLF